MKLADIVYENRYLIMDNIQVLSQINDSDYNLSSKAFSGNDTIGKHNRHIFNFYESVLTSLSSGIVDYESRTRNPLIETERKQGIQYGMDIYKKLCKLLDDKSLKDITLEYVDEKNSKVPTSFSRELISAQEHTVHHNAIIRMILSEQNNFKNIDIPTQYGIAPSTTRYKKSQAK